MPASNTPTFDSEKTEVLYGFDKTTEAIMKFLNSAEISMNICADYTWPSVAMGVEVFRKGLYDLKARNVQSRYITDITKGNIKYCKELMQISELRHLDGIKGNFALSEKAYTASATFDLYYNKSYIAMLERFLISSGMLLKLYGIRQYPLNKG